MEPLPTKGNSDFSPVGATEITVQSDYKGLYSSKSNCNANQTRKTVLIIFWNKLA